MSKSSVSCERTFTLDSCGTLLDLIGQNCANIADQAIAARVDGELVDLSSQVTSGQHVELVIADDDDAAAIEILCHSTAHLLAQAVRHMYGDAVQYAIGPALVNDFKYGFYYDFDLPRTIGPDDLPKIEKQMRRLAAKRQEFTRADVAIDQARDEFSRIGQTYKVQLLDDIESQGGQQHVSLYRHGDFVDLCRGPHLPHTNLIKAFKLQAVAGAYWRGSADEKMLTRIYGVAFYDKDNLDGHLEKVAEAERRDHRTLGRQLDLYSISDDIGPGLILWHPKGAAIRSAIEQFWFDEHAKRGYQRLYTPHIAHERIYQTSGHLEAYRDMMYSPMDIDGQDYRAKPMNCPAHIQVFNSQTRSYRDLPIRYCELGTVYRYEPSGTLHGMLRVRGFTQDDAHIFCTIEQLSDEIEATVRLADHMMRTFGFEYNILLATRPEKSIGTDEQWQWSTDALRSVLQRGGFEYEIDDGGGVFYGPKIDIVLLDSLGRARQGPTIQVDLNLPQRFGCVYVGPDNKEHQVVMVHRAVLGSMERFVGLLIEHYGGAFPLWLSPVQVAVLPVSEKFNDYAASVGEKLGQRSVRVEIDTADDKIGAKIRRATVQKTPYMLIVGEREQQAGEVSVRSLGSGDQGAEKLDSFLQRVSQEIDTRRLTC